MVSGMNEGKLFNVFDESRRLISHCPLCRARYTSVSAKVIEQRAESHLVHVTCSNCQKSILAVVVENMLGTSSVGMVTDLSSEDVLRFRHGRPITADEVLDAHDFFNQQPSLLEHL